MATGYFFVHVSDPFSDVSHVTEDHLQAAAGRSHHEPAGRAGDGVQTQSGLYGACQEARGPNLCTKYLPFSITRFLFMYSAVFFIGR